jgi:hypothetical protein
MLDIFLDQAWRRSVYLALGARVARALRAAWRLSDSQGDFFRDLIDFKGI